MAMLFGLSFTAVVSAVAGVIMLLILPDSVVTQQQVSIGISTLVASFEAVILTFLILVRPVCWFFDFLFDFEYRHRRRRDDRRNGIHVGNSTGQVKPVEEGS